MSGRNMLAIIM